MIAKGRDCTNLFPAVVKNVVSKNPEVITVCICTCILYVCLICIYTHVHCIYYVHVCNIYSMVGVSHSIPTLYIFQFRLLAPLTNFLDIDHGCGT